MTHDPLCVNHNGSCCPWMGDCTCQCTCDTIAIIRADQHTRDLATLTRLHHESTEWPGVCTHCDQNMPCDTLTALTVTVSPDKEPA